MRRKLRGMLERGAYAMLWVSAFLWRSLMFRTTFIAITGSLGKTTATDYLAAVLERRGPVVKTPGNGSPVLSRAILRVRPWHRHAVFEISIEKPGYMIRHALLIRPHIAVELAVASPHLSTMGSLETIAAEKAKLLRFLGRRGVAVLNGDDPRVAAMASQVRCRVVRFGARPEFDVWADEISSRWPQRLEFRAHCSAGSCRVRTQLVGEQWTPSVLAALAAAQVCGIPLSEAAEAIGEVRPYSARMQPAVLPGNITFLRDEANGSLDDAEAALEVLRQASAARRLLVISDVANSGTNYRRRQRMLAQRAAESSDVVVFVSYGSDYAARQAVRAGMVPENVHHFVSLRQAADFLRAELRPGDLVLLKGRTKDHLSRIYLAQLGSIECWKTDCKRRRLCDACERLGLVRLDASPSSVALAVTK